MKLAVFMDGTWANVNDDTNVSQICGRVPRIARGAGGAGQDTFYVKGVGNGPLNRLRGGVLGRGVDDNIRDGYHFLAERHQPGDEIFLVGYSRGAFTARSLAGMIAKCGIVPPGVLGAGELFARYRDRARPGLREMREGEDDAGRRTEQDRVVLAHARPERIRFIGVFDTVGSLGIPGGVGRALSRRRYEFHDTRLSGLVDRARHAVAVDEHRPEFEPTLWTGVPIPIPGHVTDVEQRWFAGAHSDVGGGGQARAQAREPLSALPREWVVDEAVAAGLVVDPPRQPLTGNEWRSPLSDSYDRFFLGLARFVPGRRPLLREVRATVGEELDDSVPRRWNGDPGYRPRNPNLVPWLRASQVQGMA